MPPSGTAEQNEVICCSTIIYGQSAPGSNRVQFSRATTSFLTKPNSVIAGRESRLTIKKNSGPVGDVSNDIPVCAMALIDSVVRFSTSEQQSMSKKERSWRGKPLSSDNDVNNNGAGNLTILQRCRDQSSQRKFRALYYRRPDWQGPFSIRANQLSRISTVP